MASNQASLFMIFSLVGFIIGILFDCFRILRKTFKTNDIVTYIEDIIFWILTGIIIIYSMYKFCDGELRFFMVIGVVFGTIIYLLTFSKYVIRLVTTIVFFIRKMIIYPIKIIFSFIKRTIFRPIIIVCINFRRGFIKFSKKYKKIRGFF